MGATGTYNCCWHDLLCKFAVGTGISCLSTSDGSPLHVAVDVHGGGEVHRFSGAAGSDGGRVDEQG